MPYNSDGVGHQGGHTSRQAAEDLRPKAETVRLAVLRFLRAALYPKTSEEIADALGLDYRTVQPRTSELRNLGQIKASGHTKTGRYGKQIIAWQAVRCPPCTHDCDQGRLCPERFKS